MLTAEGIVFYRSQQLEQLSRHHLTPADRPLCLFCEEYRTQVSCDWCRAGHVTVVITSDWSAAALREGDGGDHAAEAHPPPAPWIRGVRGRG